MYDNNLLNKKKIRLYYPIAIPYRLYPNFSFYYTNNSAIAGIYFPAYDSPVKYMGIFLGIPIYLKQL